MKKSLLIFDFDGTIADTVVVAVSILNEVGSKFGLPHVDHEQALELKTKKISELMKMSGLSWLQLPSFVSQARDQFKQHLPKVPPVAGMPEILASFHARGFRMGILSSNTQEGVRGFLDRNDLNLFEFIHTPDSLFGKASTIKKILKHHQLAPEDVVMIGDEMRDIEAAQKAGIDSIAVSWGFNAIPLLQEAKPNHLVSSPSDLLKLLG
ncbi:HAD-IA family hydrolase [Pontibacter sp. G13]|uniref:HAD-IA family hydrolase n=1 Tax=Pontibacter sp. G13 TaxID=3074898 RepID=UPI002889888C|nr:HAD-IA family hydrolase [Pontibacter sp. G13]WNJ16196.1 HAD-IA family hydrolase [Pontibacter sp. G13]